MHCKDFFLDAKDYISILAESTILGNGSKYDPVYLDNLWFTSAFSIHMMEIQVIIFFCLECFIMERQKDVRNFTYKLGKGVSIESK